MKKCLLALWLVFFLICSMAPTTVFAIDHAAFAGGAGTKDDPYLIETAVHLDNVRNDLDAHYKMIADIVFTDADFTEGGAFYNDGLGFSPIGSSNNAFLGTFDGNGHVISNLQINISSQAYTVVAGLFVNNRGSIRRLGIIDSTIFAEAISPSSSNCSSIAGSIAGYNSREGTIICCYSSNNVSVTGSVSSSYADVSTRAGGIVGNNTGSIINCYNTGTISASDKFGFNYHDNAGGIAGTNSAGSISSCYNTGAVSGDYAGGIAGGNAGDAVITDCHNAGRVRAISSSTDQAGGIVGYNGITGTVNGDSTAYVYNSYNSGTVEADDDAGGIVGSHENGTIESCHNIGIVSSDGRSGGVAGHNFDVINKCYNIGTVSGKCTGGIAGTNEPVAAITNCYNTGSLSATQSARTGGIVGYNSWDGVVSACYNIGCVSGDSAGGIAGFNYNKSLLSGVISKCYYLDNIAQGVGEGNDTATQCTASKMKNQSTYIGFDFTNIWTMGKGEYISPMLIEPKSCSHNLNYTESKGCSCTEAGNISFWYCSNCMAYFGEDGSTIISENDTIIPAAGHAVVTDDPIPATCTENGLTEGSHCAVCQEIIVAQETVPATGHAYETAVVAPTCTKGGYTTHTCSICSDSYADSETDALGHTYESVITEPTCTEDGYTTYLCIVCGDYYVTDKTVAIGHFWKGTKCENCDATRKNPFTDVPEDSFYIDPVLWAVENNITTGATATTFDPNGKCLRASVVTFLWRAAGCPEPAISENPFIDVQMSDFFYDAVLWAVSEGITNGTSETTFSPYAECNRAAVVTFLYRALGEPEVISTENPFSDVVTDAWYGPAVLWAVSAGVTNGMSSTSFGVNIVCNRAQVVTFLYRAFM